MLATDAAISWINFPDCAGSQSLFAKLLVKGFRFLLYLPEGKYSIAFQPGTEPRLLSKS